MAACCSSEYSDLNRNICLSTLDLQGIYRHKVSQDIDHDGKRISWIMIMNHYRNLSNVYLHNKANGNQPEELQKSL
jgi:hypothetical protein